MKDKIQELENSQQGDQIEYNKRNKDKIIRRYGNFVSNGGAANGLQVFLTQDGNFIYFSLDGSIKSIDKKALDKLPKLFD